MCFTITRRVQNPPVEHSQCALKSVRRPANHVAISTYKVALPASSKFNLIVPSNLFAQNYHLYSFLFSHFVCDEGIGIDVYNFEFTERELNPEKVSIILAS